MQQVLEHLDRQQCVHRVVFDSYKFLWGFVSVSSAFFREEVMVLYHQFLPSVTCIMYMYTESRSLSLSLTVTCLQPPDSLCLGPFSLSPTKFYLAKGGCVDFTAVFSPPAIGLYTEQFTMACDNGQTLTFTLKGLYMCYTIAICTCRYVCTSILCM